MESEGDQDGREERAGDAGDQAATRDNKRAPGLAQQAQQKAGRELPNPNRDEIGGVPSRGFLGGEASEGSKTSVRGYSFI